MSKRKNRQFERAQVAVEVLVTVGIFVIGAVIFGAYYIASHNKQTANVPDPNLFRDLNYVDVNYADIPEVCGNGMCRAGETGCSCERDCGYTPCCDILHPEGNGSEFSPREICDENQLFHITDMNLEWNYILGVDINLGNNYLGCSIPLTSDPSLLIHDYICENGWLPIGQYSNNGVSSPYNPGHAVCSPFLGTFDGYNHNIYYMYTKPQAAIANQGLFCSLGAGAIVKNLNIVDSNITLADENVGLLTGKSENATILNVSTNGAITGGSQNIGGLVGLAINSYILNNSSNAIINKTSFKNTGGLVGKSVSSTISNNYYKQIIPIVANQRIGGLIGCSDNSSISNNYSVAANGYLTGCFIGDKCQGSSIVGTITNSYYDNGICTLTDTSGAQGKSTLVMTTIPHDLLTIYVGWDFTPNTGVWDHIAGQNSGYPFLR